MNLIKEICAIMKVNKHKEKSGNSTLSTEKKKKTIKICTLRKPNL